MTNSIIGSWLIGMALFLIGTFAYYSNKWKKDFIKIKKHDLLKEQKRIQLELRHQRQAERFLPNYSAFVVKMHIKT